MNIFYWVKIESPYKYFSLTGVKVGRLNQRCCLLQHLHFYPQIGTLSAPSLTRLVFHFRKARSISSYEHQRATHGELTQMANKPHSTALKTIDHKLNYLKTFDCKQPTSENYEINVSNSRCIVRALTVEAIDELFSDCEQFENCVNEQNELVEPLLNCIDDRQLQFHGQLASLPKTQRRQRLVSSRAALYDNSHLS